MASSFVSGISGRPAHSGRPFFRRFAGRFDVARRSHGCRGRAKPDLPWKKTRMSLANSDFFPKGKIGEIEASEDLLSTEIRLYPMV
jgi:hypothetical protein